VKKNSLFPVFHGTLQKRRQKIFNKGLYVCAGGLDIQNFDKNCRFVVLVISWGIEVLFGGISPQKTPSSGDEWNFVVNENVF